MLYQLYLIDREQQLNAKLEKKEKLGSQIDENDKKIFHKCIKRSDRKYNLTQTAGILGVHRQTLYYWIKRGWIKSRRDYRNCPVFTVLDIEDIIKWRNTIKL
ncbi:MAG: helix-turn-helix domain-containing protein [Candidatus Omnitrophota bacterium]